MSNEIILKEAIIEFKAGSIQFKNYEAIKEQVDETLAKYDGLILTEENKQDIKGIRANLNKVKDALNKQRIKVKKQVLAPYDLLEKQVEEIVAKINGATSTFDKQIKTQEDAEKKAKEDVIRKYFEELIAVSPELAFVKFESIGLNVTLSVSEKKLKEEVDAYLEATKKDLTEIDTDPFKDKLLIKYKLIGILQDARIQMNRELQVEKTLPQTPAPAVEEEVKKDAPVVPEEIVRVTFTVVGTKAHAIKVRDFMQKEGIKYE